MLKKNNLVVTVTDWMWFPWLQHLGLVAMVGSCVLMWFVTIAIVLTGLSFMNLECDSPKSSRQLYSSLHC